MKRKPRWTLEMLTASLAVLCGLLLLVLLVQRPTAWLLLAVLVLAVLFLLYGCAVQRLIYSSRGTMIFLPERPLL